jgi:hypothetical protein
MWKRIESFGTNVVPAWGVGEAQMARHYRYPPSSATLKQLIGSYNTIGKAATKYILQ